MASSAFSFLNTGHDSYQEEYFPKIGDNDVIFGRGGKSYSHPGNRLFRRLIAHNKDLYESLRNPTHRQFIALSIVRSIQNSGGKFLKKQEKELWKTVSIKEACIKTSQALRDANVRTKKVSQAKCHLVGSSSCDREQVVVSPTQSAELPPQLARKVTQPDVSSTHHSADGGFHEIDHIEMETIHTLVRSLGGHVGGQTPRVSELQQHSSNFRPALQPAQKQASNRLSITIRDLVSKQASQEAKLTPSAYRSSSFRCSITSVSMLESSLFNADFDLEDFEIDEALTTQV